MKRIHDLVEHGRYVSGTLVLLFTAMLAGVGTHDLYGQTPGQSQSTDPAMQRARQETQVVLDLGRLIGFVDRMDVEQPGLGLSRGQSEEMVRLMGEIKATTRFTPALAERMMERIEEEILTPRQLMFTDRIWAESERSAANASGARAGTRVGAGSGAGSGAASGTATGTASSNSDPAPGTLASYAAGGPYNPLVDTSRPQGEQFEAFYRRLRNRL